MSGSITALIITFNEAANIARCLDRLRWLQRVVLLDSGSTDDTLAIARRYPNVEIIHRDFDTFAGQCNFGLSQIQTDWVLSLDADYIVGENFGQAASQAIASGSAVGYRAAFRFCIQGRRLSATLYPPRTILYRKDQAHYENEGHGHRVRINGIVETISEVIEHDDRKPLSRWLSSQIKYAEAEAAFLVNAPSDKLGKIDRLRAKAWILPFLAPVYCLFVKGLWRDGLAGLHYAMQRLLAETMIALAVIDRRLSSLSNSP